MAATAGRVLIYGGKGALGSKCVEFFKSKSFWVLSVDLAANDNASANCVVAPSESLVEQGEQLTKAVDQALGGDKIDAVICVAGGWAGGNASSKDLLKNTDLMIKQSVWTSTIAASLASKHLKEGGVLALTGAQPALKGTSGMIGYGLAKAAVHQLVASLANKGNGLPANSFVAAILPITLDTPMNRKFMPDADHSKWTPLETVAELFHNWIVDKNRPENGSLVQLITKDGKTDFVNA